jgi:[protein-PII] uridylyltransferase
VARFEAARADYTALARAGRGGRGAQARYAAEMDEIVRAIAAVADAETPVVVCAVGGYGRRTLCLHSDIDLLIVFGGAIGANEERFLSRLLQPLWDLRLTVGHHVRELGELGRMEDQNPEYLLALTDLRLLTGDVRLFDAVRAGVQQMETANERALIDALLALVRDRHAGFNDTLYQLEPDLKNAPGALRDIGAVRLLRGLARDTFIGRPRPEAERLEDAEEFLLRARSLLHVESGRDMNVLTHDFQERVAAALTAEGEPRQAVEALMGRYFRHARSVSRALEWTRTALTPAPVVAPEAAGPDLTLAHDGVRFRDPVGAAAQPMLWLEAFHIAVEREQPVADEARAVVQEHVGRYTADYFVASAEARRRVRALLRPVPGLAARLSEMLDCGLLGVIFPEFEKIHCRVIRDFYHKYTVDEHTLLTIRGLESLWHPVSAGRARFSSLLREVHAPELLTLALLYHDVGKWRDDDHAAESVRLAGPMLARLRVAGAARETVEFLIRHHLAMSRVAFRRDFGDPETVAQFATLVGNEERLKLLCLLTLVDIDAVAPGTLTPWKEDLLWRLYVDAYNHLTLGYADELIQKDQADRALVEAERPDDISETELSRFLDGLPRRYLAVFGRSAIYRHVRLARGLLPDEVHATLERRDEIWELTVAALDKPYLFSNIAGVLSYFGMNIHRGQAMTTPDHLALDVFEFSDEEGFLRQNPGASEEIARLLRAAVAGGRDVARLLEGRERGARERRRRTGPTVVHLDNEHSEKYTVVEILADDAPGLLFRISRAVSEQACDLDLVLISTEGQRAIDVLHVTKHGRKLDDRDQLALQRELERTVEAAYETH